MQKYGLKLWSTNDNYISEAVSLYTKGIYHYIELYVVPGSYGDHINKWKELTIPFVIHAPHSGHGLNLARRDCIQENLIMVDETRMYADQLKANIVIFHPGVNGSIEETVFQLNELHESRMVVENKPYYSIYDRSICNGYSYDDILYVMENTGAGFCLDMGHAICAANAQGIDSLDYIKKFLELKPEIFHLSDGNYYSDVDEHENFGSGNYPLRDIIKNIPNTASITIETRKKEEGNLSCFQKDVIHLMIESISIRLIDKNDLMNVFKLENDPIVRKNSFNEEPISIKVHVEWFNKILKNKNVIFYAIEFNNEFCGIVRFDGNDKSNPDFIITIHLSNFIRNKGLGSKIIKITSNLLLQQYKESVIYSYIKTSNESSYKCFIKADYNYVGEKKENGEYYILEYKNN